MEELVMAIPAWLPKLSARDEKVRAANGLTHKKDGWYKSVAGKPRYICKPCSVSEVTAILPARIDAIRAKLGGGFGTISVARGTMSLEQVVDAYQAWLYQRLTTGHPKKLARRTYDDAMTTIFSFAEIAGPQKPADAVGPIDFSAYARTELAGKAASTIRRRMIYIEAFANWAAPGSRKAGLLMRPWRYGADFRKPSDHEISRSAADSDKTYSPEQIRRAFLRVSRNRMLRAVGWLALCGAFAPKDLGTLPEKIVDLDCGYIRFPRGKTGVGRLCWLPPCARMAVKRYLDNRGVECCATAEGLLFRSSTGLPYFREPTGEDTGSRYDSIGNQWSKIVGLPLSGLRSTFATLADDWPDQRAVDVVLGHLSGHSMSVRRSHYAKKLNPERVRRLVCAVLPLAFGRKIPAPAAEREETPQPLPPAPTRHGSAATATPQKSKSGNAGSSSPAAVRPSRKSRLAE
jgi:hypothetical protein